VVVVKTTTVLVVTVGDVIAVVATRFVLVEVSVVVDVIVVVGVVT
jgi:hypothetical protein